MMTDSTPPRFRGLSRLILGGLVLSLAVATGAAILPLEHAAAATVAADGGCSGVTVVVDFTDIGGGVTLGCAASGFATGRDALQSAGFASTDSQPGLVCTINANPDPCPTTFEGSYWSYWHGTSGDAAWTSYQVGADGSHPVAGGVEGWRYNDGAVGPGLSPQDAATRAQTTPSDAGNTAIARPPRAQGSDPVPLIVGGGLLVLLLGAAITVMLRRRVTARNEQ
jgi:hypothetical protein